MSRCRRPHTQQPFPCAGRQGKAEDQGIQTRVPDSRRTGSPVTVPLNELALSLLPHRPENEDGNLFRLPLKSGRVTKYVRSIRDKAGITGKELTYHCSRHTAATLAISAGAELYPVSKILGHRNLVSTQVYAKVNLDKKIEAVNLTNGVFD